MTKIISQKVDNSHSEKIKINLLFVSFKDENNIHFVHAPHLDLTGYGNTLQEAKKSFDIVYNEFIEYSSNKQSLKSVLKELGWKITSKPIGEENYITPGIEMIIGRNKFVTEIFNSYSVTTFHKEVKTSCCLIAYYNDNI